MKHILFPIDNTQSSLEMIQCIIAMYPESGMRFYIMPRTVNNHAGLTPANGINDFENQLTPIQNTLNEGQKLLTLNWKGDTIKNIQEAVVDYDLELIVLAVSKIAHATQNQITSFNKDIITRVKCPVFLVPEKLKCHQPKQIVLLTDYRFAHHSRATSTLFEFVKETDAHLSILQLSKKSHSLTADQITNKLILENSVESLSHSFHFVIDKTIDKALQFFIHIHKVDVVVLFAKHINLTESLLFSPEESDKINDHRHLPFLIIHE